jgi:pSer/pThr/pTyr-binding forkhead associated (FHA) protein
MSFNDGFNIRSVPWPPNTPVSGNSLVYNGTQWVAADVSGSGGGGTGDITAVNAGTNMTGGGDTGDITISLSSSVTGLTNLQTTTLTASNITGSELNIDYIDFVTGNIANPAFQTGRLYYDINTADLQYNSIVNDVSFNLGQQLVVKVKNNSLSTINKGKLVRINGGIGANPTIATASWENDANSANTIGMMMNTINHNDFGYVLLNGVIIGVDTNTFSAGETIYLSSSGDYTNTKPIAPRHTVRIGEVIRVGNSSIGSIFVNIQNGLEVEELHDVLITSASNGDLLAWNSSDSLWKNIQPSNIAGLNTVYAYTKFVDMSGSNSTGDGSPSRPYKTIQKAIDELGYPTNPTDNKNIRHIVVNGGIYPEDITIPPVGVWKLVANGYVTLGNGSGNFLVSSVTGSVYWTNNPSLEVPLSSSMRPSLTLTVGYGDIYAGSTHVAYNTCGWNITGKFQVSSSGVDFTTTELNLHGVRLTGQMDLNGKKGGTNIYLEKCYLANASTQFNQATTPGTFINYAKDCEFDGLVSVDRLDFIKNCDIGAGVKWNTWTTDGVVINGFFGCQIAGNLSSSVGAYRADNLTRALSPSATFSGAATTLTELSYYSASNPSHWILPAPTTLQSAIDRLAAQLFAISGSIP